MMKHVLQYERNKLTKQEQAFIDLTVEKATKNNVNVHLIQKRSVSSNGGAPCSGFVTDEPPCLAVATGKPKSKWFPVFIHESCHMDQFLEPAQVWTDTKIQGADANDLVFLWVEHMIELNAHQLERYIHLATMVELDCEKRTIQKILAHKFDIDPSIYTQRANAYVYFYLMLAKTRRWYTVGREPYAVKEVWEQMPKHFNNDYTKLSREYARLYKQFCC
jgi:hypothetical protein